MYHPALDTHVSVPETAVDIHRVSGWVPADEYVPAVQDGTPAVEEPKAPQGSEELAAEEKKPTKAGSRQTAKEQ
jgi:hypothetical protein